MYLYSDLKHCEIVEDNKKKARKSGHREVSIFNYQNLNKNIGNLKESITKKNLFLEKYIEKEKIIEEKSKEFELNIKRRENELKNRNSKSLINILDRVISSNTPIHKEEKDLFITDGDFTKTNKKFEFQKNCETIKTIENGFKNKSSDKLSHINLQNKASIEGDVFGDK